MKKTSPAHDRAPAHEAELLKTLLDSRQKFQNFLSKRIHNPQVAEDLLQDSLARAIQNAGAVKKKESIVPWFYRILRNALIDYYRAHAAESKRNDEFLQDLKEGEVRKESARKMDAALCSCMEKLLPALHPAYAEALERVDLKQEPVEQVAEDLGLKTNNLMVRLHRARQSLKTNLEKVCGACTEHGCLNCTCHH